VWPSLGGWGNYINKAFEPYNMFAWIAMTLVDCVLGFGFIYAPNILHESCYLCQQKGDSLQLVNRI
jgi:hypothetical protein